MLKHIIYCTFVYIKINSFLRIFFWRCHQKYETHMRREHNFICAWTQTFTNTHTHIRSISSRDKSKTHKRGHAQHSACTRVRNLFGASCPIMVTIAPAQWYGLVATCVMNSLTTTTQKLLRQTRHFCNLPKRHPTPISTFILNK